MSEEVKTILLISVLVGMVIGSILYSIWQFKLCYPEVSDSIYYCIAHAS